MLVCKENLSRLYFLKHILYRKAVNTGFFKEQLLVSSIIIEYLNEQI